ncbi:universal stress protein [Streptomyces sp. NPDC005784]|uniref:universal stress protein n=1 Tax=Streptomyces sp. NPDC005784 TaxID=3364731 RepID=UPI003684FBA3
MGGVVGNRVVVGVDGSSSSLAAVEAAAREARWRRAELRVVHAIWPVIVPGPVPMGAAPFGPAEGVLPAAAERLVTEALHRAGDVAPEVEVTHEVVAGEALTVLELQSRDADLVVIGSRGRGGFVGMLLGSTAVYLAAHSRCPVMVVREQREAAGPIVLGVDGSRAGEKAVDFTFAEAALRGADIVALHVWTPDNVPVSPPQVPDVRGPGTVAEGEERLLAQALAGRQEKYPDVSVRHELVHGVTHEALIEASRTAQLVVVGARGRGGFTGLLLGSVSQALLHHAHCPVAVVRGKE